MEIQKAGDNSQQYQIQNLTINQGIDEKRAREIYDEKYCIAKRDFTEEALRIVNERVKEFENRLIPKIEAVNDGLKSFADPSFQLLLVDAQKAAAATERPADYDLLSELLLHRIEKGNDRYIRTGISQAVKIIEEISDEALLGLTVVYSVEKFTPNVSDIKNALGILNNLFGKIMYAELPQNEDWLDQLDILNAIRINRTEKFINIKDYYLGKLNGLIEIGIYKDSEKYYKAQEILQMQNLSFSSIMVDNPLDTNYVRVNVNGIESVDRLNLIRVQNGIQNIRPLLTKEKNAIKSIFELYSRDGKIKQEIDKKFKDEWNKYTNLCKLNDWWNNFSYFFDITSVGKVLAHANAQRCDNNLPAFNQYKTNK